MGVTYLIPKSTAAGGGSGGAWGAESVGIFGVGLPGTFRHEVYAFRDTTKDAVQSVVTGASNTAGTAFSIFDFVQKNWKLLAVGAVALIVLLKD